MGFQSWQLICFFTIDFVSSFCGSKQVPYFWVTFYDFPPPSFWIVNLTRLSFERYVILIPILPHCIHCIPSFILQAPHRQEKTHIYQLIGGIPTPWKKWKSDWIIIPTTGENKKVPVTTNQKTYLPFFWTPRTTNFMEFLHLSGGFSWSRSPLVTERVRPLRVKRNGAQTPPDAVVMVNLSQTWSNLGQSRNPWHRGIPNPVKSIFLVKILQHIPWYSWYSWYIYIYDIYIYTLLYYIKSLYI